MSLAASTKLLRKKLDDLDLIVPEAFMLDYDSKSNFLNIGKIP